MIENGFWEMLPNFDFQFIAHLAFYGQMVDFQVVEPLGY